METIYFWVGSGGRRGSLNKTPTCVDFCLRGILHALVLDDIVGNLATNQRLHVCPLKGHHGAGGFQVGGQAEARWREQSVGNAKQDKAETIIGSRDSSILHVCRLFVCDFCLTAFGTGWIPNRPGDSMWSVWVCMWFIYFYFFSLSPSSCCCCCSTGLDNNVGNSCFDLTAFRCHLLPSSLLWALSPLLSLTKDKSTTFPFSPCCSCLHEKKKRAERDGWSLFHEKGTQLSFIFKDNNKSCCCPAVNPLLFFCGIYSSISRGLKILVQISFFP